MVRKKRRRAKRGRKAGPVPTAKKQFQFIRTSGGIREYRFRGNGLQVLLMEDHSAPVVTFMVTYRVGSRNEAIGYTGSTHLLEHLMFKGTPAFNKKKGNSVFSVLQNVGAQINATTWNDRTNYFENLPADELELAIRIESDRMRNAWIRETDRRSEMTVVRNEFERGENDPFTALHKQIWATAYQAHPYHHDTIGWRSDIENVPIERLKLFYDTYYWPDNATVTLIGDYREEEAFHFINKYFGSIRRSPGTFPELYTSEPKQEGRRRVEVKRTGEVGIVAVAFKKAEGLHPDQFSFDVLDRILTQGKNSRYYRLLVDTGMVSNLFIDNSAFRDPGLFTVYAFLTPGTDHEKVETMILEEIRRIGRDGVTGEEIERAKAQVRTERAFSRDGSYSIASELNEAIAIGDWTFFTKYLDGVGSVTPDKVKQVANHYLVEDQSTTGWFIPLKPGANGAGKTEAARFLPGPKFYRPDNTPTDLSAGSSGSRSGGGKGREGFASRIRVQQIEGIGVYTMKTGVKDVVTLTGSLCGGDIYSPDSNRVVADLTGTMLDQGTKNRDRFRISEALENVGADLSFTVDTHSVYLNAHCLKKDVPLVIGILAEELRMPAFNEEAFLSVKKRRVAAFRQAMDQPDSLASTELTRRIFPGTHPNYEIPFEKLIADTERASIPELKKFHSDLYGPRSMVLVAVGDVDEKEIAKAMTGSFPGWNGGTGYRKTGPAEPVRAPGKPVVITMKEKTSASLVMGQTLGLNINDPDYLPLMLGTYILGGNFSARLMQTVRDREGLTYGIGSQIDGHLLCDGYWYISGTFAPESLEKGYRSTRREFDRWLKKGITRTELENKKQTIRGSYKVGLATTRGLAGRIHGVVLRGYPVSYLDDYLKEIDAVRLDQVNRVIKKYIHPENLFVVAAGSVGEDLKPA